MNDPAGPLLVVGGGQGIGRAIAALWPARTTVWTRALGIDATQPDALFDAFAAYQRQHGAPFALVHAVGDFHEQSLLATDHETYRHLFASNVDSAFHVMRTVVPAMVAAGRGRVLLFAAAGVDKDKGMLRAPVYFAAKAALVQLARSLALETAKAGVTVNVIAPGLITHPHSHQDSQQRLLPRVPAGRLGSVDDVTGLVRYLLSDAAAYLTGQVLTVDGGLQA
jgi:3-oxoacyl-[acyl-carrier protein] reductase